MNEQQRDSRAVRSMHHRREAEMLLFLVASVIGIYGLGQGLTGLFEPGQGIDLLWLAVTSVAMMVLFAQMGRVHDTWPRRRDSHERQVQQTTQEESAQPSAGHAEER
jgi:hypothetical protein